MEGLSLLQGAFGEDGESGAPPPGPEPSSLLSELKPAAKEQPAEPTVVNLSRREMAVLRSSLPSPNKHKGKQLAEKMGIKSGPDTSTTQIGNVQFVADAAPADSAQKVRASWRFRSSVGTPTGAGRRIRLRGRRADKGDDASGSEGDE
ncbi:hypothetical protein GPECTOR_64g146 [Gonium pectorale]|uniref:Uncharacterized protein n=1 Tax=Gonium pectorale TaxID=33097 RepID=A0A150G458_GONPE|nr:hypothetical protein GPECTOR_64g146 [Gonium pectorale]|eukprot:KXZ44652.1 hypothetical protein GPECTOR_64g146 [Gonium pectorale]